MCKTGFNYEYIKFKLQMGIKFIMLFYVKFLFLQSGILYLHICNYLSLVVTFIFITMLWIN